MKQTSKTTIAAAAAAATMMILSGVAFEAQAATGAKVPSESGPTHVSRELTPAFKAGSSVETQADNGNSRGLPTDITAGGSSVQRGLSANRGVRTITRSAACSENPFAGMLGTLFGICDNK